MLDGVTASARQRITRSVDSLANAIKELTRPLPPTVAVGVGAFRDSFSTRAQLMAQNALLRQQLIVLRRSVKRPRIENSDRLRMVLLARLDSGWRQALHIIKPDTLLRWHQRLFKLVWRRKSKPKGQPAKLSQQTILLIQKMARENSWGAERIRGELLKLGIKVSKRTIQKYMRAVRRPGKSGKQTWKTFLKNHSADIWACDFLQLYDVLFRPIFAFFIIKHESREVVHLNVTRSPSDQWVAQQLREATPYGQGPRYLIRDNDDKFGAKFTAAAEGAGTEIVKIPPKSPNLNPICERFLGSVRRECLDHVIILSESHLRRVVTDYGGYFNGSRPHQGIHQRIPADPSMPNRVGRIVARPVLGGLHHDYRRVA
jgi:putative transposase